jgi:hypothetical protein
MSGINIPITIQSNVDDEMKQIGIVIAKSIESMNTAMTKFNKTMKQVHKSLKSIDTKGITTGINKMDSSINGLTKSMNKNSSANKANSNSIQSVLATVMRASSGWRSFGGAILNTTGIIGKFAGPVGIAGVAIGLVAGVAVKASKAVNDLMSDFIDFEYGLSKFSAISGEMQKLDGEVSKFAQNVGLYTQFTTTEAMTALNALAQVGFKSEQAMSATLTVLDLAIVGNLELGRSAEIMASAMRQFQLDTSEGARVADAFSFIANNTGANVEDLAQGFKYLGTAAAQAGFDIEGTAILLGVLNDLGLKSGLAGRGSRQALNQIEKEGYLDKYKEAGDEQIDSFIKFLDDKGIKYIIASKSNRLFTYKNSEEKISKFLIKEVTPLKEHEIIQEGFQAIVPISRAESFAQFLVNNQGTTTKVSMFVLTGGNLWRIGSFGCSLNQQEIEKRI